MKRIVFYFLPDIDLYEAEAELFLAVPRESRYYNKNSLFHGNMYELYCDDFCVDDHLFTIVRPISVHNTDPGELPDSITFPIKNILRYDIYDNVSFTG